MNDPFFSIVIPTFNRASLIVKAIDSVYSQAFKDFEIIVIDDGSTDNTEEVIKGRYKDKLTYKKIENSERGAARNRGIETARGKYVTFLDSDDYLLNNYLQNAYSEINLKGHPPFFHQGYQIVNDSGRVIRKIDFVKSNDFNLLAEGNPLSCLGVFLRRDILKKHCFNEDRRLAGSEDWELWLRLSANYGFVTSNKITACLVDHDYRSVINYDEKSLILRKELALEYSFKDEQVRKVYSKYLKKMNASCDTYIALHLILSGNKKKAIKYLCSFKFAPQLLFRRRTLAIIKHLFS